MGYTTGIEQGADITVEPIRKIKDIKAISKLLESNPRNYLLWIRPSDSNSEKMHVKIVMVT